MSLMNVADWPPGQAMPSPFDFVAQEQGQYNIEFQPAGGTSPIQTTMDFVEFGRYYIEQADGGNAAWDKDVELRPAVRRVVVRARGDQPVPRGRAQSQSRPQPAHPEREHHGDPAAVRSLEHTSVPTGRLQVPELDMKTISDQLVPVQQENYYRKTVDAAGRGDLLRQAFVQRQLHCNFQPSELVAGVHAVQHRVDTGRWGSRGHPAGARSERHQPRERRPDPRNAGDHPVLPATAVREQRALRPVHGRLVPVPLVTT